MPQTYIDALNLKTPAERAARWSNLMAGSTPMQAWAKKQPEVSRPKHSPSFRRPETSKDLYAIVDRRFGQNSPPSHRGEKLLRPVLAGVRLRQRAHEGHGTARRAIEQANQMRRKTTGSAGIVGAQHNVLRG